MKLRNGRADNNEVNSVLDLKDKVVAGASMLLVLHQAKVFADNGMSLFQDVAQVSFQSGAAQPPPFLHALPFALF